MPKPNHRFYFCYGADLQFPHQGGYTAIDAEDMQMASRAFQLFHPNRPGSVTLNCLYIFDEKNWRTHGLVDDQNCPCREIITVSVTTEKMDSEGNWIMEGIGYRREVIKDG